MNSKSIWIFVGVLIAVSLSAVFFIKKPKTSPVPTSTLTSTPIATVASSDNATGQNTESVTEIQVSGKEFSYSPSTISVKRGDKVKIAFKNVGTMPHDFVIEELSLRTKVIGPGESDTLAFTVPDDGSPLTYFCSVGSHRALGMEGKFIIK